MINIIEEAVRNSLLYILFFLIGMFIGLSVRKSRTESIEDQVDEDQPDIRLVNVKHQKKD